MQQPSNQFVRLIGVTLFLTFAILTVLCLFLPRGVEILWINGNYSPFQDKLFSTISVFGNSIMFVLLIVVLAFIKFNYAVIFGLVFFLNSLCVIFLKRIVFSDMLRPVAWLDNSLLHFVEGVDVKTLYSFPSGHTATVFAMAISLSLCIRHKGWSILLMSLAFGVGYSRIYLLQHHLEDVLAGAIIGTLISFFVYYLNPISRLQEVYKFVSSRTKGNSHPDLFPPFIFKSRRIMKWVERIAS